MTNVPYEYYLTNRQLRASIRELRRHRLERGDTFDVAARQLDALRKNAIKNGTLPVGKVFRKRTPEQIEQQYRAMRWWQNRTYSPSSAKDDVE
jgi:hypothetical protein